jgi:hypothetical protein
MVEIIYLFIYFGTTFSIPMLLQHFHPLYCYNTLSIHLVIYLYDLFSNIHLIWYK